RVLDLTPEEAEVLKKGKLRRVGVIALISVLFGGVVAFFVVGSEDDDRVVPVVNFAKEPAENAKPVVPEVEAKAEHPQVEREPNAVPEMKQETQPSGASTETAAPKGTAVQGAQPKSPKGDHAKAGTVKPQKPVTETRPEPNAPKLFGGK